MITRPSKTSTQSDAIILGSAINQDGRSSGLTAPNGPSQTSLISIVMSTSNVAPSSFSFVALHGTGTPLGDPIEVSALGAVLEQPHDQHSKPVTTGSVKACYGHTEGAAGVTGMFQRHVRIVCTHLHATQHHIASINHNMVFVNTRNHHVMVYYEYSQIHLTCHTNTHTQW